MNEELIMTEEEARRELFKINDEYMSHSPLERINLYEKYKMDREKIKNALSKYIEEERQSKTK